MISILCISGLPLLFNIEGPSPGSDLALVLGARPITGGYDQNFAGSLSAVVYALSSAQPSFSECMLACLESLVVNTIGTPLTVTPFNVSSRQLQLLGQASPQQVQQALRSAVYLNRAPNPNINAIQLEVSG